MPSLNVTFSDEELERVRSAAQRRGQALKPYAHDAILAVADDRNARVTEAFRFVTERSTELNKRLA